MTLDSWVSIVLAWCIGFLMASKFCEWRWLARMDLFNSQQELMLTMLKAMQEDRDD